MRTMGKLEAYVKIGLNVGNEEPFGQESKTRGIIESLWPHAHDFKIDESEYQGALERFVQFQVAEESISPLLVGWIARELNQTQIAVLWHKCIVWDLYDNLGFISRGETIDRCPLIGIN